MSKPRCFFEVKAGGRPLGRIVFQLDADIVPKTVENFRALCTHEKGFGYRGSVIHKIVANFLAQGGDITEGKDEDRGKCIYGEKFADENFVSKHTGPGILSMANSGPDTNNSQFCLSFTKTHWLDDKHVVFGKVVEGMKVVREIESYGSQSGKPSATVEISKCGELKAKDAS